MFAQISRQSMKCCQDILYNITDMNLMVTLKENNEDSSSLGRGCLYKIS